MAMKTELESYTNELIEEVGDDAKSLFAGQIDQMGRPEFGDYINQDAVTRKYPVSERRFKVESRSTRANVCVFFIEPDPDFRADLE